MDEFVTLVKRMREAQKEYFRTRQPQALKFSKVMESKVDRAIETFNNPKLFDDAENTEGVQPGGNS